MPPKKPVQSGAGDPKTIFIIQDLVFRITTTHFQAIHDGLILKMCNFALYTTPTSMNENVLTVFLFFILQVVSKFLEVAMRMRDYEVELFNQWKAETNQTLSLLMKRNVLIMVNSPGAVCVDSTQLNTVCCKARERWQ